MRKGLWMGIVLVVLAAPGTVSAQAAWDSPLLLPPGDGDGLGLYLIDIEGGDIGGMLTWRSPTWNFGVRGGIAEGFGGDVAILAGIDFSGGLTRSTDEFPLDIDWVLGAGLGIQDVVRISFPLGLSLGHTFPAEGATFTPFVTPRVVLDAILGDENDRDDDTELEFALDFGLDLRFRPDFTVRFAGTVGDRDGVAIGIVF
jgi:hypothetical protein